MNRNAALVLTSLVASSAFAGSPPHWMHDQAAARQANAQQASNDSRDVGRNSKGGDWKGARQPDRQRESPPAPANPPTAARVPLRPADGPRTPPRVAINNRGDDGRGERRGLNDPRPNTNWQGDHDRSRDDNRNRDQDRNRDRDGDDRNWNNGDNDRRWHRDRDNDWNRDRSWQDRHGRDWRRDRGWYDHYRYSHYRYYGDQFYARTRFSIGFYFAPWGYAPQAWFVGDYLPFVFMQDRYYLDNFGRFDLYEPPYGCEWVRAGSNALLVDVDSGYVLDVIHNLFW